jgi:hypothetical protein
MPDTCQVKYIHSGQTGAPVLSGTAGSLVAVLDACLVTGFGSVTLDSLVVASEVATCTVSSGHSFGIDVVIEVAGASPAGLNGQWRCTGAATNTFTFACPGITDQTATGTITAKVAPLGWSKPFTGTNKAAFKQVAATSSGFYLRVDDSGANVARVVGYEQMTGVDLGTYDFPTAAQQAGGLFWRRSSTTDSTARPWMLFGTDRGFWFLPSWKAADDSYELYWFGDVLSYKVADAYGCWITGANSTDATFPGRHNHCAQIHTHDGSTYSQSYLARGHSGLPVPARACVVGPSECRSTAEAGGLPAVNAPNNGLLLGQARLVEGDGLTSISALRAIIPGLTLTLASDLALSGTVQSGLPGMGAGARYRFVKVGAATTSAYKYGIRGFALGDWF